LNTLKTLRTPTNGSPDRSTRTLPCRPRPPAGHSYLTAAPRPFDRKHGSRIQGHSTTALEVPPACRGGGPVRVRLLRADRRSASCILQVWHYSKYSLQADENRISVAPIVPNRGIITDRNGVVLAKNYSAYTLEITPSKLNDTLDNVIDNLATVIPSTPATGATSRSCRKTRRTSRACRSAPALTDDEVARFTAQRFRFPGVEVRARLFRQYPLGPTAAHVIGYIGRISQRDQDRIDEASDENDKPIPITTIRASTRTTTRARTTSARSASSRATKPNCTARPVSRKSK
jgi:hypothetical protein